MSVVAMSTFKLVEFDGTQLVVLKENTLEVTHFLF